MKTHTTLRCPSFAFLVGLLTASLIVCGVRTVAALDVPLQVTPKMQSTAPDIRASLPALRRAARTARKLAKDTGTPMYVLKKGRVVDLNAGNGKRQKKAT